MTAARSQNGYTANDRTRVKSRNVAGTNVNLTVRVGPAGDILLAFASDFDKRVEDIDNARGHLNDWGYAERPIRGSSTTLSNHASGTAEDLNADKHPLGKRGTFSAAQVRAIYDLLAEYDHCIRWGGDYSGRKDEMHFEVVTTEAHCKQTLATIRSKRSESPMTPQERKAFDDLKADFTTLKAKVQGSQGVITMKNGGKANITQAVQAAVKKADA